MGKKIIPWGISLFLLSPCIVLVFLLHHWAMPSWGELFWALGNSILQSFFSALFALGLGFVVALGAIRLSPERFVLKSIFDILCLVTQFIPVVVSLVAILNLIEPFPNGILGMVIVHVFLNFGLAAILLSQHMKTVWGETSDMARTLGVTRFLYWRKAGLPLIKKELGLIFLYLFSLFFTSFSVPLIVGGGRGTTLEILIYEKMRLSLDWSAAVVLAWVQVAFIFILSFLAIRNRTNVTPRNANIQWLGSYAGVFVLLILMASLFAGYSSGLVEGWIQRRDLSLYMNDLGWGFLNSIMLGLITFVFVMVIFEGLSWVGIIPEWLDRFLNGYLAPSTSLTCFAFLILLPAEPIWSYFKIPLAFVILSAPALYRMGFGERLKDLHHQIEQAKILGAEDGAIFNEVTWPQIKSHARFLGALVATWACGDFAVARILSTKDFTLGLITQTLLSTYRSSLASVVSVLLLLACLSCFFLIMGWDYVDRRKS